MEKLLQKFNSIKTDEKALGLVEALIAMAIVGSAMVIITQVSLRTIKMARKNEMEDVAVQAAVEAMDFVKQPGDMMVKVVNSDPAYSNSIFELDVKNGQLIYNSNNQTELTEGNCDESSDFRNLELGSSGYIVCQQIRMTKISEERFDAEVIVIWETIGREFEIHLEKGYRIGKVQLI
jgi:hypothetical protein